MYLKDKSVLKEIEVGEELGLIREENKFDENAILIYSKSHKHLGYIPEKDNLIFARLMDAGKMLKGRILEIEESLSFSKIKIGIYLVDF